MAQPTDHTDDVTNVSEAVSVSEGDPYNGRPRTQLSLTIREDEWEDVSFDRPLGSRLSWTGSPTVAGASLHLEAWEVRDHPEHGQRSIAYPEDLDHLAGIYETAFQTIEINGREYVIVALPSSA